MLVLTINSLFGLYMTEQPSPIVWPKLELRPINLWSLAPTWKKQPSLANDSGLNSSMRSLTQTRTQSLIIK